MCVNFSIYDDFGDGLMYGQGSWYIKWEFNNTDGYKVDFGNSSYTESTNNYVFWSPSGGDYGFNESLSLCRESYWKSNDSHAKKYECNY